MTDPTSTTVVSPDSGKQFFGHPRGLVTCFMVEFFERFTYYGMRSMLVLFLVGRGGRGRTPASASTARRPARCTRSSRAAPTCCAIPGGWIADRLIGQRKAIFFGGLLIAAGNFILAIPATPTVFYSGVFVMVLGIGLLKPNVSSVVGALYEGQPGARRDAGFSIFYMGINLGATIGPLTASALGEKVNWHLGYLVCGIATLAGTLYFLFTQRYLGDAGLPPRNVPAAERKRTWTLLIGIAMAAAAAAVLLFAREHPPTEQQLAMGLFAVQVALAVFFFGYVLSSRELDVAAKKNRGPASCTASAPTCCRTRTAR